MSNSINIAFAGQSNAAGHFFVRSGDRSGGKLGNDIFEAALGKEIGTTVNAINLAYSGSGSNQYSDRSNYWWNIDTDKPGPMLQRFVSLLKGRDIEAVVWAQGEDDARMVYGNNKSTAIARYTEATKAVFDYIRKAVGDSNLPIFVQELGTFPKDVPLSQYDAIRGAMQKIIDQDPNIYLGAETQDLRNHNSDNVHYSNAEYGVLAKRLAETVGDVLDDDGGVVTPPKPTTPTTPHDQSFTSQSGRQSYVGTGDDDQVSYASSNTKVWINLETGNAQNGHAAGDKLVGIENIVGSRFDDILKGDAADNDLFGGAGNDRLMGGTGNDRIDGGAGDDRVEGNAGADILSGGAGSDVFGFVAGDSKPGARDIILDFDTAYDRIDLGQIDANGATQADDAFDFIGNTAFSGHAGELRWSLSGGDALIEGDANGDGAADFQLVLQDFHGTLQANDFIF